MPNWCMTTYKIVGKRSDVEQIEKAVRNHPTPKDTDKDWEGNVLAALEIKNFGNYRMRGFVRDCDYISDIGDGQAQLSLFCEEAWSRTDFAEALQGKFPDVSIYWMAEETGCEVYQTNDSSGVFFPDRYFVDTCIDGTYESEYFADKKSVFEWLSQICRCECQEDVDLFNKICKNADSDDFIYIHEFEIV